MTKYRKGSSMAPERLAQIERQVKEELRQVLGVVPTEVDAARRRQGNRYQPYKTYLITAEGLPVVKIGRSKDPKQRMLHLQTGQPVTLSLAWTSDGIYERELHHRFADYRVRGEWFDLSPLGDPVAAVEAAVIEIQASRAA